MRFSPQPELGKDMRDQKDVSMTLPIHESINTEFKADWSDTAKKTFCAFLNGRGGTVYFGILDDGTPVGVNSFDVISDSVSNVFRKGIHPDASDLFKVDRVKVGGLVIAAVVVKEGPETPYSVDVKKEGARTYVRTGSSTFEATREEIRELFRKGDPIPYELRISKCQKLTFNDTKKIFEENSVEFSERTMELNGLIDRDDGRYTNLALWLSDQNPYEMRLGFFEGNDKASKSKGFQTFQGSILKQYQDLNDVLSRSFSFSYEIGADGRRIERHAYPLKALREALINTCVHRDYTIMAQATVTVFSDRIEFITLGSLPPKCDFEKLRKGISVCRNEWLCRIFFRLKKMEKYGIGIPLIFDLYDGEPMQPLLDASDDMVSITLPRMDLLPSTNSMPGNRRDILLFVRKHGPVSRVQLQEAFQISYGTAIKELTKLMEEGWLVRTGAARNTRYVYNFERHL